MSVYHVTAEPTCSYAPDPADKAADGGFQGTIHRTGYGARAERLAELRQRIRTLPGRTLAGGEGKLLEDALTEAEQALTALALAPQDAP